MTEEKTVGQAFVERVLITQELMTENERLREENKQLREDIRRLAEQGATLSVCNGNVTVTIDAFLTAEEREAIEQAIAAMPKPDVHFLTPPAPSCVDTLRNLLERTK